MKNIIIKPLISEKSLGLAKDLNKYTFVVPTTAEKVEIAEAVSKKFEVSVKKIDTSIVLGKTVRWGKKRIPGKRSMYKKAVVTLKQGDKISIFDVN